MVSVIVFCKFFFFVLLLDCADALPQKIVACLACVLNLFCLLCLVSFWIHNGIINWFALLLQLLINTFKTYRQS